VRDGHGDLRAEHVLLERDGIRIVDCIEFDPALRQIDVASDLAFLVMDLEGAGRDDLARCLVAAYRAAGGDPGDDALLHWLAAYRAQVRAKVALVRAAQQTGKQRAESQIAARRLLDVADRLIWRARGPVTIAVGGLAASGKTTLAAALAARAGVPHLPSDALRKAQAGLPATARGPAELYTPERNAAVYAELGRRAAAARDGAVADATFRSRTDRERFTRAHGAERRVLHVECVTPAAERSARARARVHDPDRVSDADVAVTRTQTMDPLDEVPAAEHVVVRGDGLLAAQMDAVADALDREMLTTD
jgi:predicted kinase